MAENVKVAVRLRPFNQREKERNASLIVKMEGQSTFLQNPKKPDECLKRFNYDYSYWSHDGYIEREDGYFEKDNPKSKYCDQKKIFDDLGEGILRNAWDGYNSTLFAYGQTGSGKSYSVVGYKANKGVVPVFADRLFKGIEEKVGGNAQYEVSFSMVEIYNEKVRDLLNADTLKLTGGLKIRQNPTRGFFVEGLETVAVGSYADIDERISEGTKNRTVAATNMNATSSRAHTIVGITFVQKTKNDEGKEMAKTSVINLVDLAGSERVGSTGATGQRFKEGTKINQSLSTLGNVISALADCSGGKKVRVPYRESVLTKLLQNALSGNSKTVMIAAISPADINYDETLSTLRYADRAKQIKTTAKVNEDETDKLVRELREENQKLKAALAQGGAAAMSAFGEDLTECEREQLQQDFKEQMEASVRENERKMQEMEKSWQEKLDLAKQMHGESNKKAMEAKKKITPYLYNLNADPQMTGVIVHFIENGVDYIVGKPADDVNIPLSGASILEKHASVYSRADNLFIRITDPDAVVRFNGELLAIDDEMQLRQNDRILFGTCHLYVFCHPAQYKVNPKQYPEVSYEMAQDEISACIGLSSAAEKSKEEAAIWECYSELRPLVEDAISMSEELDQKVTFEFLVVPPHLRGVDVGKIELMLHMQNLENEVSFILSKENFINKKHLIQEMYQSTLVGQAVDQSKNPFVMNPDEERLIASAVVSPRCLANMIDMQQQVPLVGYDGDKMGVLNVGLIPYDSKGRKVDDNNDQCIDDPRELIGKKYKVVVNVINIRGLPTRFKDIYVKYDMFLELDIKTKVVSETNNPDFNFSRSHNFTPVTSELISWMKSGNLIFQVWGKQEPQRHLATTKKTSDISGKPTTRRSAWKTINIDKLMKGVLQRRCDALEEKLNKVETLLNYVEQRKAKTVRVADLKKIFAAPQPNAVDRLIQAVAEQGDQASDKQNEQSKLCQLM